MKKLALMLWFTVAVFANGQIAKTGKPVRHHFSFPAGLTDELGGYVGPVVENIGSTASTTDSKTDLPPERCHELLRHIASDSNVPKQLNTASEQSLSEWEHEAFGCMNSKFPQQWQTSRQAQADGVTLISAIEREHMIRFILSDQEKHYKELADKYNELIDRYNKMLREANTEIESANARLARQQQINTALTIYSMMPRYQPPPMPVYQPPIQLHLNANCTSNSIGTFTYTNCY